MIVVPFIAVQNKCHFSFVVWYWMTPSCSLACIKVLMIIRSFTWATRYFWAHHVQPNFHRLFDNHKITLTDLKCQTCTTRDFIRTDHFTLPVFPTARRQQSQTFTLPNFQNGRLPQWMTSTILNKFPHCQTCTLPCILLHCHVHTARHPYCLTFMHYQIFTLPEFHTAILSHSHAVLHSAWLSSMLDLHTTRLLQYPTSTSSTISVLQDRWKKYIRRNKCSCLSWLQINKTSVSLAINL